MHHFFSFFFRKRQSSTFEKEISRFIDAFILNRIGKISADSKVRDGGRKQVEKVDGDRVLAGGDEAKETLIYPPNTRSSNTSAGFIGTTDNGWLPLAALSLSSHQEHRFFK